MSTLQIPNLNPIIGEVATVLVTTVTLSNGEQTEIITAFNPKYFSFECFNAILDGSIPHMLNSYFINWKEYQTKVYTKRGETLKVFTEYSTTPNPTTK